LLYDEIASGGMASVHVGRLVAEGGFARVVAIKQLHPQHAKNPQIVAMLRDEARLAARIRHPNVAAILDVVANEGEVFLVMEYVHGESLAGLLRATTRTRMPVPLPIALAVLHGTLEGLSAAHLATSEAGEPLGIVHRDVSPENVMVGVDGVPRVLDFGIALAAGRSQVTREGALKGKLGYMAPELLEGAMATPISDVYSAGVVLWEALTSRRLFTGEHEGVILAKVLRHEIPRPSSFARVSAEVDEIVMRAVSRAPFERYPTAHDFARAIDATGLLAAPRDVAHWVTTTARDNLDKRNALLQRAERGLTSDAAAPVSTRPAIEKTELLPTIATDLSRHEPTRPDARASEQAAIARARRNGALAIAALAALVATCASATLLLHKDRGAASTKEPATSATAATPSASAAPAEPTASASAAPSELPVASSASAPPASASSAPTAKPRTNKTATPRPPNCDPPYTVDANGIHHYKSGCL
jgi:serine/threonine-protein kinase